jgi:AAA+ superfamily predicted ATPase
MIKRRPTFPTGYSLAGLPAVAKALHSDNKCELYSLVSSDAGEMTLLLLWSPEGSPETYRLTNWLNAQHRKLLTVHRLLTVAECPTNASGFVLELRGRRIDDESLKAAEEGSLRRLFHSMLDLIERGQSVQMYPDFNPSLSWQLGDEGILCTLLPLDEQTLSEVDQIRHVAKAFYWFATGIETGQLKGNVPALLRWSKFGGEELSRIVDRCLAPSSPKESITTLIGLNNALGRFKANNISQGDASKRPSTPPPSVTGQGLDKVAGMHVLKELLRREVVAPIRNPEPYRKYGLSIPNGILLYGPPGCGKTYIARQLAEELGHYFVEIIPSELASPFIHQSVIKIRDLFDTAAEQAPAVLFIDEFEALVPSRETLGGHQDYKAAEVNEFLAHLNSCSEKKIFVIAATNQPKKIDAAVRRTGRLDKLIYVGPPDEEARREMLALHLEGRPLANGFGLGVLAKAMECYSASDLRFLVDEAARDALTKNEDITYDSFRSAMAKVPPSITPEVESQYQSIQQRGL